MNEGGVHDEDRIQMGYFLRLHFFQYILLIHRKSFFLVLRQRLCEGNFIVKSNAKRMLGSQASFFVYPSVRINLYIEKDTVRPTIFMI